MAALLPLIERDQMYGIRLVITDRADDIPGKEADSNSSHTALVWPHSMMRSMDERKGRA
jgi:hypothetical protein